MLLSALVPALISAAIGLALITFAVRCLLRALPGFKAKGAGIGRKLKKKLRLLAEVDTALDAGRHSDAMGLLKETFYLEQIKNDRRMIAVVHSHNLESLSRLVTIAEERGGHVENLALIEGLFQSRRELLESYLETNEARRNIKNRRKEKGREMPSWGDKEFAEKIEKVRDKIFVNKRTIKTQLQDAFRALQDLQAASEITYH